MVAVGTLAWASFAESLTTFHYTGNASQVIALKVVPAEQPKERTIKEAISWYGEQYGYDTKILGSLAFCESTYRDICIIDSNGLLSCGPFQFQKSTMKLYCPDLKWNDSVKNDIMCAGRMVKLGMDTVKSNWVTCSKNLK